MSQAGAESRNHIVDVRIINPFIVGIQNVFTTMLDTHVLISKPCLKKDAGAKVDISTIIGFSGDTKGSVAICYPLRTAINAASKFAGEELTLNDPDFADALGELANMIAGQAKSRFEGVQASISMPRVIVGQELRLLGYQNIPTLLLPCDSALGRFSTEIIMVDWWSIARQTSLTRPAGRTNRVHST